MLTTKVYFYGDYIVYCLKVYMKNPKKSFFKIKKGTTTLK